MITRPLKFMEDPTKRRQARIEQELRQMKRRQARIEQELRHMKRGRA
jgi:type II secretory pathway component PulM